MSWGSMSSCPLASEEMTLHPLTEANSVYDLKGVPFLAIDLGFAQKSKSCGLSDQSNSVTFGKAIELAVEWVPSAQCQAVLLLEAPLSASFDEHWNPVPRGDFETHDSVSGNESRRVWQSGAGGVMSLAAIHFLRQLIEKTADKNAEVHLVEGFCSRYGKPKPSHIAVAKKLSSLWKQGSKLASPEGYHCISSLYLVDSTAPKTPPSILRVPDGFC
jgi:hypothetical protein